MDEKQLKNADPSPWHPIKDAVDLKHLGKFCEELGECVAAVSRCIIQGLRNGECEPVTKKPNLAWLEDEVADVLANAELQIEHFNLDMQRITERKMIKREHLKKWHAKA